MKKRAYDLAPGQIGSMKCGCAVECYGLERVEISGKRAMLYAVTRSCAALSKCVCDNQVQREGLTFLRLWDMPLEFDPLASALSETFLD